MYTINIDAWAGWELNNFLAAFHRAKHREKQRYGVVEVSVEGSIVSHLTVEQEQNVLLQVAHDIFDCLDDLSHGHGKKLIQECPDYIFMVEGYEDYDSIITRVTAQAVLAAGFSP